MEQPAPSARTSTGTPCRCTSGTCATAASRTVNTAAVGHRDGQIHQHPPRITRRPRPGQPHQRRRDLGGQRRPVRQIGQQPRPGMGNDTPTISGDRHRWTSGSLHAESAFQDGHPESSASSGSLTGQALSHLHAAHPHQDHGGSGAGAVACSGVRPGSLWCSCGFPRGCPTPVAVARSLRFQLPPVEPCMRFSRTRLTDVVHRRHSVFPARPGRVWVRRRSRQG